MIPEQRRQRIKELAQANELLMHTDLIEALGVSESTLRRDLNQMAQHGEVVLLRGGGIRIRTWDQGQTLENKLTQNTLEKEHIAKYAAQLVYPDDVVFLDPSSITYLMIPHLSASHITVATNSLQHLSQLIKAGIRCLMVGGEVQSGKACHGNLAESSLQQLRFSKCFLGTDGMSVTMGLTTRDANVAALKRMALQQSANAYFLVDSSKYNVVTMYKVADIEACHILIDRPCQAFAGLSNLRCASS